jgi:hypothetical protein
MTVAAVALDSLLDLLPDWQVHLRAKGRSPATIASYLTIGRMFADYLSERGMPVTAGEVAREHVEPRGRAASAPRCPQGDHRSRTGGTRRSSDSSSTPACAPASSPVSAWLTSIAISR